jgi:hypothetical protein
MLSQLRNPPPPFQARQPLIFGKTYYNKQSIGQILHLPMNLAVEVGINRIEGMAD